MRPLDARNWYAKRSRDLQKALTNGPREDWVRYVTWQIPVLRTSRNPAVFGRVCGRTRESGLVVKVEGLMGLVHLHVLEFGKNRPTDGTRVRLSFILTSDGKEVSSTSMTTVGRPGIAFGISNNLAVVSHARGLLARWANILPGLEPQPEGAAAVFWRMLRVRAKDEQTAETYFDCTDLAEVGYHAPSPQAFLRELLGLLAGTLGTEPEPPPFDEGPFLDWVNALFWWSIAVAEQLDGLGGFKQVFDGPQGLAAATTLRKGSNMAELFATGLASIGAGDYLAAGDYLHAFLCLSYHYVRDGGLEGLVGS